MKKAIFFGLILTVILSMSFTLQQDRPKANSHMPSAIIYKTKADYSQYVSVTLSDDKSQIVTYPAPQDVFYQGKLAVPTALSCGYMLDNRGVTINSCFIKITYADYAKLASAPSTNELYKLIIDKNPFKTMYDLGPRNKYQDEAKDIDAIIKHHHLRQYKKLL